MKKSILFLSVGLLINGFNLAEAASSSNKGDANWRIGAKIHFEEDSGADYIGLKAINKITKDVLKEMINIHRDLGSDNAKILLKKDNDKIIMTHYEEKPRPGIGEEMHATLLYTRPRGFHKSETLQQICQTLFKHCESPPTMERVVKEYNAIIKPERRLQISEIVLIESQNGSSFISAKLLLDGREHIYKDNEPISPGLHMTLVNCPDGAILSDPRITNQLIEKLNTLLKGKMMKIATKEGVMDLEFGISGEPWRIRVGERVEINP